MKNTWIAFVGLAIVLTIAASCNKTSLLGAELFESDKLNLQFTDTLTVSALNDAPEPVLMYVKNAVAYDSFCVGNVPDAYFGKTESAIYANFGTRGFDAPVFPSLDTALIDSVRLILPYNSAGVYGDTTATQKLSVYRLTEELKADTIYSDKTFAHAATPLGSITFKPTPNTTIRRIIDTLPTASKRDTFIDVPHISIPLDIELGKSIMRLDASIYKDTVMSGFHFWLKGLVVKAETPANCMLSFNVGPTATTGATGQTSVRAGIYVYYRKNKTDTTRYFYAFQTSRQVRYANYKNDYKNGKVNEFVNNPAKADSLIFLKSLAGPVTRLELPTLKNLGNIAINKAELEFVINEDTDVKTFPPLEQLLVLGGNAQITNGNLGTLNNVLYLLGINASVILDARQSGFSATAFSTIPDFGGFPVTEKGVRKYKINITQHLQRIISGAEGTQIYLTPHFYYTKAGRVVLYGPKNSKYRAKLNLFYTTK